MGLRDGVDSQDGKEDMKDNKMTDYNRQKLLDEIRQAMDEWLDAEKRASLPPSMKKLDELNILIILPKEEIDNYSKASEERDKAWKKYLKVIEDYLEYDKYMKY